MLCRHWSSIVQRCAEIHRDRCKEHRDRLIESGDRCKMSGDRYIELRDRCCIEYEFYTGRDHFILF